MLAKDCGQCWPASDLILEHLSLAACIAAKLLSADSVSLSTCMSRARWLIPRLWGVGITSPAAPDHVPVAYRALAGDGRLRRAPDNFVDFYSRKGRLGWKVTSALRTIGLSASPLSWSPARLTLQHLMLLARCNALNVQCHCQ